MNTTNMKLLALILMLFDHVAEFIPGMPIWFHWIGRISAPIFFFCTVWGLYYTHDRKKYLGRLYVSGAAMGIIVYIFNNCCPNPQRYITNNIFVTLFLIGCISMMIEKWKEDRKKGWKLFLIFFFSYRDLYIHRTRRLQSHTHFHRMWKFIRLLRSQAHHYGRGTVKFPTGKLIFILISHKQA